MNPLCDVEKMVAKSPSCEVKKFMGHELNPKI